MKTLTKLLMWLSGIAASNAFKYISMTILAYVAAYWAWVIVSEPFKWIFE